jgi:hypothetical protein
VHGADAQRFIFQSWGVEVTESFVSKLYKDLGFKSKVCTKSGYNQVSLRPRKRRKKNEKNKKSKRKIGEVAGFIHQQQVHVS